MRYWFDTEFYERPGSIQLISLGIVAEDGRTLYIENADFVWGECRSAWLREYVKPHLTGGDAIKTYDEIGPAVLAFVGADAKPEFWAYYADYDWVVFCWLFGSMVDLPKGWPMFCRDLKQWAVLHGDPKLLPMTGQAHNALDDAEWCRRAWLDLSAMTGIHHP